MKRMILTGILALATGLRPDGATAKSQCAAQPAQAQAGQASWFRHRSRQAKSEALQALSQAQGNPDATIKAADELLTKYADTEFKEPRS